MYTLPCDKWEHITEPMPWHPVKQRPFSFFLYDLLFDLIVLQTKQLLKAEVLFEAVLLIVN